jgi:hypothetical protein
MASIDMQVHSSNMIASLASLTPASATSDCVQVGLVFGPTAIFLIQSMVRTAAISYLSFETLYEILLTQKSLA